MSTQNRIIAFIGPSGAGKSTLAEEICKNNPEINFVRSFTTRPKRSSSETSHVFVNNEEFDRLLEAGRFLRTFHAYNNRYGLPMLEEDKIQLIVIRAKLVNILRKLYSNSLVIEVDSPISTLEKRLQKRNDHLRINSRELQAEIDLGRDVADYYLQTTLSIDECTRRLEGILTANEIL